jgi:hypothetical protein
MPYSVYGNGIITFQTAATGTFDVIYDGRVYNDVWNHNAAGVIAFVSARGLFGGIGDNLFNPDGSITRAMFVQVLANLDGADLSVYSPLNFADVPQSAWYAPPVAWAVNNRIDPGYGGGLFGPEDPITREQMAVMLANYVRYRQIYLYTENKAAFSDEGSISTWALDSVLFIQAAGIINGRPGNIFDPQGTATRAEVAAIFTNYINAFINHVMID